MTLSETRNVPTVRKVFITGGTGYIGWPLLTALMHRGHEVCALVRSGSEWKLPSGSTSWFGHTETMVLSLIRAGEGSTKDVRVWDVAEIRANVELRKSVS